MKIVNEDVLKDKLILSSMFYLLQIYGKLLYLLFYNVNVELLFVFGVF